MEALIDIGRINYSFMGEYIESIGNLTFQMIGSNEQELATYAIEFWTTLCEKE